MYLLLLIVLVILVIGTLPRWSHSRRWGYLPAGIFSLLLIVALALLVLERIAG